MSAEAKDLIQAFSWDPSYYQTALNELIIHFDEWTIVVNAFINQLENWPINHQNKKNFNAFMSLLKWLVQAFQYLGFIADIQSTTLLKKTKKGSTKTHPGVDRALSHWNPIAPITCWISTFIKPRYWSAWTSHFKKNIKALKFCLFWWLTCQFSSWFIKALTTILVNALVKGRALVLKIGTSIIRTSNILTPLCLFWNDLFRYFNTLVW